jgi:hypothetical protein
MTIESRQWVDRRVNSLQFTDRTITTVLSSLSYATAGSRLGKSLVNRSMFVSDY